MSRYWVETDGNTEVRVCGETVPDGMMLEEAFRSIVNAMARLGIRRDPDEIMTLEVRLSSHRHGPVRLRTDPARPMDWIVDPTAAVATDAVAQFEQQRQRIFPSSHLRHEEPILPATMDQMFPQEQPAQPVQEASLLSIRHAYQLSQEMAALGRPAGMPAGCVICGGRAEFLAELEPGSFTRLCSEHRNQFITITVSGASAEEAISRMREPYDGPYGGGPLRVTRNPAEQVVRHFGQLRERMLQDAVDAMEHAVDDMEQEMMRAEGMLQAMPPLPEEMNRGEAQQE